MLGLGLSWGCPADRVQGSRDSGHIWGHGCSRRGQWPAAGPTADHGADVTRGFAQLLGRVSRWQRATELQGDVGAEPRSHWGAPLQSRCPDIGPLQTRGTPPHTLYREGQSEARSPSPQDGSVVTAPPPLPPPHR